MKVWFHGVPGPYLITPLIGPGPYGAEERLRSWVPPDTRLGIGAAALDRFIERLIVETAIQFGFGALDAVDPVDEAIGLPEIEQFDAVIAFRHGLVTLPRIGELAGFGIRFPYHYGFPAARVQLSDWAMRLGHAVAEGPIPYTQVPTTFRTFPGWIYPTHLRGPTSFVVGY